MALRAAKGDEDARGASGGGDLRRGRATDL